MSALSSSKYPSSSESVPSSKAIENEASGDHSYSPAPLDSKSHLGGNVSSEVSADPVEDNMDASIPTTSDFNWVLPAVHGFSSIYRTPESVTYLRKEIMDSKLPLLEMKKIKAAKKDSGAESSARPTIAGDDTLVIPIPETTQSASPMKKRNEPSVDLKTIATTSQPAKKKKQIKGTSDDKWFDCSRDIEEETLWGRSYKKGEFFDNFLIHEANIDLIEKQGVGSTYQAIEAYNLRVVALARLAEEEKKDVVRMAKKMKVENERMKGEFAKVESMKKELEEAWKDCNLLAEANKELFVSNNKLSEDLEKSNNLLKLSEETAKVAEEARSQAESELENSKKSIHHDLQTSLSISHAKWEAGEEELNEALTDYYIAGFDSAVAQVHLVLPEEDDISEVGVWKEIIDGRLVEAPDNEGNGGNNPDS